MFGRSKKQRVQVDSDEPAVSGWVTKVDTELPGLGAPTTAFTVVRRDAELAFITATVEAHGDGLDEFNADFLDASLEQRHQHRLRAVDDQAVVRTQQATDAEAATSQARHEAALHTADARRQVAVLERRLAHWTAALAGASPAAGMASTATETAPEPATATTSAELPAGAEIPEGWVWAAGTPGRQAADSPADGAAAIIHGPNLRTIGQRASEPGHIPESSSGPGSDHTRTA